MANKPLDLTKLFELPKPQAAPVSLKAPANNTPTPAGGSSSASGAQNPSSSTETSPVASNSPTAAQIANDFNNQDDVFTQTANEEKKDNKTNNTKFPTWYQINSYNDDNDGGASTVTAEGISAALNDIVKYELSEKGKEDTIFYSDKYNQGFTHNGKVVNGSCTEGGMKKAILGGSKYITVTDASGETLSGVEAMAKSYDSVLDLYTQEQFKKVLADPKLGGYGTFTTNCNFLKHTDEIREKYGIDIKVIETQNADGSRAVAGIQNRTFEISLVDEKGNIIEDENGNKSTILFGDWVIPDGCAQGAEFDFISVIDQAGFDCVSKADFIDNEAFKNDPQFQDANGNYDPGKAYAHVIGQLENEFNNVKAGKESEMMRASDQTINEASYKGCTFTWWSAGGGGEYYGKSGLDAEFLGGVNSYLEKAFDANNDGILSEEEQAKMAESLANEKEPTEAEAAARAEKAAADANDPRTGTQASTTASVEFTNREYYELQDVVEDALAKNANADIKDIIAEHAQKNGYSADEYVDVYYAKLKDTKATATV